MLVQLNPPLPVRVSLASPVRIADRNYASGEVLVLTADEMARLTDVTQKGDWHEGSAVVLADYGPEADAQVWIFLKDGRSLWLPTERVFRGTNWTIGHDPDGKAGAAIQSAVSAWRGASDDMVRYGQCENCREKVPEGIRFCTDCRSRPNLIRHPPT